jgi:predicted RNase H-like nuclease
VIAGVDGYKDKWIAVIAPRPGEIEIRGPLSFLDLYRDTSLDLIVIDIPIGLADLGYRRADQEARRFLGKRHSCVFSAPIRPILDCDRLEACEKRLALEQKKCSKQQVAIFPKVTEIDKQLRYGRMIRPRVLEGHPEVSFTLMNKGMPLPSKHHLAGKTVRRELVEQHFSDVGSRLEKWAIGVRKDILDACALLWTGQRISSGSERRFPEKVERDRFGLPMQIFG